MGFVVDVKVGSQVKAGDEERALWGDDGERDSTSRSDDFDVKRGTRGQGVLSNHDGDAASTSRGAK